jgi:uncharacterized membrane protein
MRIVSVILVLLCLPLSILGQAPPQALTFSNLSGAFALLPLGVSQQGFVGYMCCQSDGLGDEAITGFIQQRAKLGPTFSLLGQPLAGSSLALGINSAGTVVGGLCSTSCGASTTSAHGFSTGIAGGGLKQIDYPGNNVATIATGINTQGVIVGSYCLVFGSCERDIGQHGFQDENNVFTTIDYPGATFTALNGINDNDVIVGSYVIQIVSHAFFVRNGVFTTIDPPGAKSAIARGTNKSGVIVGTYVDSNNKSHGFKYVNGAFTTIDFPNAGYTTADGIDAQGEIVGTYRIGDGEFQGYLAK